MKKILIVDDEDAVLLALSHLLKNEETVVVTCGTIEDAETAINAHKFDVILADIRLTGMQGLEGLELLSYVKEKQPDTKVIIMTGFGSDDMREDAMSRGAFHYYEKPVDFQDLKERIGSLGIKV